MSDYLLIDGDLAMYGSSFGPATALVRPGRLTGSGPATLLGKRLCIAGDERSAAVAGCSYVTPSHPIPGVATLEIAALAADQTARKTRSGRTPVLRVGGTFTAMLVVQSPAQQPTPAGLIPDPLLRYPGTGTFFTTNTKLRGA